MGASSSDLKEFIPHEGNRYPFSMKFIASLERLISSKRNAVLRECNIPNDEIYYLNAILDLHEIISKFEEQTAQIRNRDQQQQQQQQQQSANSSVVQIYNHRGGGGSLKPQTIYDYLFTINKIKLDLENFPKQFNNNKLYQQLYQFCSPINLNQFIDLFDINEIKAYVLKESNQQIKEYQFNAHFVNAADDQRVILHNHQHMMVMIPARNPQNYIDFNRQSETQSISSQSTAFE